LKNALTFDVEDWYQSTVDKTARVRDVVIEQTSRVLAILADAGVQATFFILGLVAEAFPGLVKKIHRLGHEIGTHGYSHELVFLQTPPDFAADLNRSMKLLEDLTGCEVFGYRAPDFSITSRSLWALDILEQSGILYDSSIFPIWNRRYGIAGYKRHFHYISGDAGGSLIEFPLSTVRILGINLPMCGGGYFRLLPYPIIRSAMTRINSENTPAMIYMHPYELDSQDLASPLSGDESLSPKILRITQNFNRAKSEIKLRNLLKDFTFSPAAEVLHIDR
jgi:polysaccharide deacetylase family protein (PEP-CTERM system associated)